LRAQISIPLLTKPNMHDKATQVEKKDFSNPKLKILWRGGLRKSDILRKRTTSFKNDKEEEANYNLRKTPDLDTKAAMYLSHYSSSNSPRKIIDSYKPLTREKKYSPQTHKT
jgi:hypothetical protein